MKIWMRSRAAATSSKAAFRIATATRPTRYGARSTTGTARCGTDRGRARNAKPRPFGRGLCVLVVLLFLAMHRGGMDREPGTKFADLTLAAWARRGRKEDHDASLGEGSRRGCIIGRRGRFC